MCYHACRGGKADVQKYRARSGTIDCRGNMVSTRIMVGEVNLLHYASGRVMATSTSGLTHCKSHNVSVQ